MACPSMTSPPPGTPTMRTTSVGPSGRCKGTTTRTSRSPLTCATQGSSRVRSPRSVPTWPGWPRATPNESDAPALLCCSVCAGPPRDGCACW
eukprot:scaffold23442_cov50-Phaeocystis_antarctica.AAC.2